MESAPLDRFLRPLRDLRISVTDRCNLRCSYCMPAELYGDGYRFVPRRDLLTFEEIERFTRLFGGLGATKVRITGGEPLLRQDLPALIERLAKTPGIEEIALTTNGVLLARHAEDLRRAGLRRVTISLDSLDEAVFREMNARESSVDEVLAGIAAAERAGLTPIKINCVVQRNVNDHTLVDLARHFRDTGHIVRFIEFMDVGTLNAWELSRVVTADEILERVGAELPLRPLPPNYPGEVARRFEYRDGQGEIGIVASVSRPFCGACSRARLTTEGRLFTCLFASEGTDLRGPLRDGASDDVLLGILRSAWSGRADRYSEERSAHTRLPERAGGDKIEMYQIGG